MHCPLCGSVCPATVQMPRDTGTRLHPGRAGGCGHTGGGGEGAMVETGGC